MPGILNEVGIPFGFVSGYSDTQDFPPDLQHVPLLVKPFDERAMREFLEKLLPTRRAGPGVMTCQADAALL